MRFQSRAQLSFVAAIVFACAVCWISTSAAQTESAATLSIRGKKQSLRTFGPRTGDPIIVSSSDGGWVRLAPHVADVLAAQGFFVVGFDVKAYLESFTSGTTTLRAEDEPTDYRVLADFAAQTTHKKPMLIGVSEGAGLSVLAATDPRTKAAIAGVIALGLPDLSELGWRWKDSLIYVTHGVPNEPTFRTSEVIGKVTPVPLGVIHSTHDEFFSVSEVQKLFEGLQNPRKIWVIDAADHRFSDNLAEFDRRLVEAVEWVQQNQPR
jgi:pimeloyl-ACP methyl ester carboxylesterase